MKVILMCILMGCRERGQRLLIEVEKFTAPVNTGEDRRASQNIEWTLQTMLCGIQNRRSVRGKAVCLTGEAAPV